MVPLNLVTDRPLAVMCALILPVHIKSALSSMHTTFQRARCLHPKVYGRVAHAVK